MENYVTPNITYLSAATLNSIQVRMSGSSGGLPGGSSGGSSGGFPEEVIPEGFCSFKKVLNKGQVQLMSNGEIVMRSSSGVFFKNSQTLEEENMWLYKFWFVGHGLTTNKSDDPVAWLWKAKMNLDATINIQDQHYDIYDENISLGSYPPEGSPVGKFEPLVMGIAMTVVGTISTGLGAALLAGSLASTIGEYFSAKENDFQNRKFYREWEYQSVDEVAQFWEVAIEIPPGKTVEFKFSYDIWSDTDERLTGTPITCRISAPGNLIIANNNKGVTYKVS